METWNPNEITIRTENISKIFREGSVEVRAVTNVSLQVKKGEMVAVMGPSGSGKTTLVSMLGCILRPTQGKISIMGREVSFLPERDLPQVRRDGMGFIFQAFNLFPALTALENVCLALQLKGVEKDRVTLEGELLLGKVGLSDRLHFLPRDLSGGQKQRVAIARALAGNPPIIFADEPTGNLDSKSGHQVIELLRDLAKQGGRSVVMVTHDPRLADTVDRVLYLEDGQLMNKNGKE